MCLPSLEAISMPQLPVNLPSPETALRGCHHALKLVLLSGLTFFENETLVQVMVCIGASAMSIMCKVLAMRYARRHHLNQICDSLVQ